MEQLLETELEERVVLWLDYLTKRYPILSTCRHSLIQAFTLIKESYRLGGKLLVCGNGGSAADSDHICSELMKSFLKKRPLPLKLRLRLNEIEEGAILASQLHASLPVIPLASNGPLASAIINDMASDLVFAQQVVGYGRANDCFLAISTSGNSSNVIKATIVAKSIGLKTIGLTGINGGKLNEVCNVMIKVPANRVYQVQELHLPIYHTLCAMLEEAFF